MGRAKEWILTCESCGNQFTAYQNNPNLVPKYCDVCKCAHHKCPTCGNWVGIGTTYCGSKCAQNDPNNLLVKEGHKKQSLAVTGENNPAKRDDVRAKISRGVKESYTEDLRKLRSEQVIARGLPSGKYDDGQGNFLRSLLEVDVSRYLQIFKFNYQYEKPLELPSRTLLPDFTLDFGTIIEVAGWLSEPPWVKMYKEKFRLILGECSNPLIIVTYGQMGFVFDNLRSIRGLDIVSIDDKEPRLSTIRIEDLDVIDYFHVLPFHEGKCNQLHAHSSQVVSVEVTGVLDPIHYMAMDFGLLKGICKEVAGVFDHHFVIGKKYIKEGNEKVLVSFTTLGGEHTLELPKSEVTPMEDEATIEAISEYFCRLLFLKMPPNIVNVKVEMSEGVGKSAC